MALYSETLAQSSAAGWTTWACPAGKRAIAKCVLVANDSSAAIDVTVQLGPVVALSAPIPAHSTVTLTDMVIAVYTGSAIQLGLAAAGVHAAVGGYLFDDPAGALSAPGEVTWSEVRHEVTELPELAGGDALSL